MTKEADARFLEIYRVVVYLPSLIASCIALLMLGTNAIHWLRFAQWPVFNIADMLRQFGFHGFDLSRWLGLQKLVWAVMEWPAWCGVVGLGLFLTLLLWVPLADAERGR